MIHPSELVLNPDGSIYHLKLHPDQLAEKVILVGDPGRVSSISSHFQNIEHKVENREFVTHTGEFQSQRISVVATGIGTDNIDIVLNELDALVNVDLEKREVKAKKKSLQFLRLGTCGSIQPDIKADEKILSTHALGLDGLLNFYRLEMNTEEKDLLAAFREQCRWTEKSNFPYLVSGEELLRQKFSQLNGIHQGMTITAPGFYAPQGRSIRLQPANEKQNQLFSAFSHKEHRLLNYEMETSALYGLSRLLGHRAATICLVVANRSANSFSKDYKSEMKKLIGVVLEII